MEFPFISDQAYSGYAPINLYFHPQGFNGRPALVRTPGLTKYCDTKFAPVRGMELFDGYGYAVVGDSVYRFKNGTAEAVTGTLNTSSGNIWMAAGNTYLMIVEEGYGHYIQGLTMTEIVDPDFPSAKGLSYQDGYFIVISGDYFYLSPNNDPSGNWDALDFASAEGLPDEILAVITDHRETLMFGERSVEPFYNSGASPFNFERVPGGFMEIGICAPKSVAKIDNSVFWLADDFTVRVVTQYTPMVVSPPWLSTEIFDFTTKSDAIGFTFYFDGAQWYCLAFPTEQKTYLYNTLTKTWCRWAYGASQIRHRANCALQFEGKTLIGDYLNGKIYYIDKAVYTDDSEVIRWTRVSPEIFGENRESLFFHTIQFEFKQGVGLVVGQGSDPKVMLDWTNDRGKTWSNEHWLELGKIGEYETRTIKRNLGTARNRMFRLAGTDPVIIMITGAVLNVSQGTI